MRNLGRVAIAITAVTLSGCSFISGVFDKKPHYHATDGTAIYTSADSNLRTAPQQPYQFASQSYGSNTYSSTPQYTSAPQYHSTTPQYTSASQYTDVSQYSGASQYANASYYGSTSQYEGYDVQLYSNAAAYTDPRKAEFVKLNGKSDPVDWQNCETRNRGYLFMSEYDFSLNPGFEVCMRNMGYVLSTEYNAGSKRKLSAETAGLRGGYAPSAYSTGSSYFP